MHPTASSFLLASFAALTLAVVAGVVVGVRRVRPTWTGRAIAAAAGWLALTSALALSGVTAQFDARPPPFVFVLVGTLALGLGLGLSRVGLALAATPLPILVGFQAFRLPLELLMHHAATEGVMPPVMSYTGRNLDIVAGAGALVVAVALWRRAGRGLAWAWVVLAFATLGNVVFIAVRASPLFAAYGPEQLNTWVAYAPFIWLPTVLVATALAGQIVVVRALLRPAAPKPPAAG